MKLLALLAAALPLAAQQPSARALDKLPPAKSEYYTGNLAPLAPGALIKLPPGAVKPSGWLLQQLRLEADGFSGRLTEISRFCKFRGSAWTSPSGEGEFGWEEAPYWLKGFTDLGYVLQDARILAESRRWLDAVMASQREDGYFGSRANLKTKDGIDLWPNMVMLYPLRTQYEATGDARILDFMKRYFRWQTTIPTAAFLTSSWQKWRAGDNLDTIYWLYNHTGERWLLDLARMNHVRTADWTDGIPTWHGVNIAQCFREPAQYYQQARDPRFIKASERVYDTVIGMYGQVPGGLFGADENARPGYAGPRQGAETCAMAEMMHSAEMLLAITGDGKWADRAEDVTFNSFPASMTPDLKGLHYLTAPNQVRLDRKNKAPMVENDGDMFSYNPHQYRCCQHNAAFGWPYFAGRLWMAAGDNGLAAALYAPGQVKAKVAGGAEVEITETTDYPFDETIRFAVAASRPARFPLFLRIPAWCSAPRVSVNGRPLAMPVGAGGWIEVDNEWKQGDEARLELPMGIRVRTWEKNRKSVSVDRGPLTYSLKIGERWQRYGDNVDWPGFEVFPTTAWNYGLIVDTSAIHVAKRPGPLATQPFTPENAPVVLGARGRRIPQWKMEANGMVGELPQSPARGAGRVEEITLIPMGCARLRVSVFPQVD